MITSTLLTLFGMNVAAQPAGATATAPDPGGTPAPMATPATPADPSNAAENGGEEVPEATSPRPEQPATVFEQPLTESEFAAARDVALAEVGPAREAYHRSLMPFDQYLEHVASINTGSHPSVAEALKRDVMADAVRRLEAFDQPAAMFWAADLAEARYHLAVVEGAPAHVLRRLADRTIARRVDEVGIGHTSHAELAEALLRLLPAGDDEDSVTRREALRERAAREFATQARLGVGRPDEVLFARMQSRELDPAETYEAAVEILDDALRFRGTGTASLFDVASMHRLVEVAAAELPQAARGEVDADLVARREALRELTVRTRDRRGRIEADVRFVQRMLDRFDVPFEEIEYDDPDTMVERVLEFDETPPPVPEAD